MKSVEIPMIIDPLPMYLRIVDWLLRPLMRFIAGPRAWFEEPQRTHFWNNTKLPVLPTLWAAHLLRVAGDEAAVQRWLCGYIPLFHIPILGGWRRYVVIEPVGYSGTWYPGWVASDVIGCSRISVTGPVRLLQCPVPTDFFGITTDDGQPITLRTVGFGTIGDNGQYCQLPLL